MIRKQTNINWVYKNKSIYELIGTLPPNAGSEYVCDAIRFYKMYKDVIPFILSGLQAIRQGMSTVHLSSGGSPMLVDRTIDDDVYSLIAYEDD